MGIAVINFEQKFMEKGINVSLISDILNKLPDGTKLCGLFYPTPDVGNYFYTMQIFSELFKEVSECELYPNIFVTFHKDDSAKSDNIYLESVDMSAALKAYTEPSTLNLNSLNSLEKNISEYFSSTYQKILKESTLYGTGQTTIIGYDPSYASSTSYTYIPTAASTMLYPPNTVGPSDTVIITEDKPGEYYFNYTGDVYNPAGIYSGNFQEIIDQANKLNITYKFKYLNDIPKTSYTVKLNIECECGAHKTGNNMHSKWCCLYSE